MTAGGVVTEDPLRTLPPFRETLFDRWKMSTFRGRRPGVAGLLHVTPVRRP